MNHAGAGIMKLAAMPPQRKTMPQERHDEVPRLEAVHGLAQALGAGHVHTGRRSNERRAQRDERHVDGSTNDHSGKNGKYISQ